MADVLLIDPDPRSEGLCAALRRRGVTCVGAVPTLAQAAALIAAGPPHAIVVSRQLQGVDGVEAARVLRALAPRARIVLVVDDLGADEVADVLAAGVSALSRRRSDVVLADVVCGALAGATFVEASTALELLDAAAPAPAHEPAPEPTDLTRRELEVLGLLGTGLDPRAIASRLDISVHTARGHVKRILAKLEAHSQLEAVVVAHRRGLLGGRQAG
jgi:DNA-binding NarL/FixJ family response regulator